MSESASSLGDNESFAQHEGHEFMPKHVDPATGERKITRHIPEDHKHEEPHEEPQYSHLVEQINSVTQRVDPNMKSVNGTVPS